MLENIKPRKYQEDILETCKKKSCLVILPTGIGKTLVALMLAIERMKEFPEGKVVFLAPTRPLAEQHLNYFQKHLPELYATMELFTGKTNAEKRRELWQNADIIFSTPQCIVGETTIFTEEGPIKIENFFEKFKFNLQKGNEKVQIANIDEKVLGYRNNKMGFVNAVKAIKIEDSTTIKIKTEIGNILECTPEHPLLTLASSGNVSWKNAGDLKLGDYTASINEISLEEKTIDFWNLIEDSRLKIANKEDTLDLLCKLKNNKKNFQVPLKNYSRFKYNHIPFKTFFELIRSMNLTYPENLIVTDWQGRSKPVNLPRYLDKKLSYVIGAMLGDGHLGNRKGHGGEIVFSDLDHKEVSSEFGNAIKELFGQEMKEDKNKGLICYNSALSEVLLNLGIPLGRKAQRIRVPKFIFFSSMDCVAGFIKGIFDTDGSAGKYNVSISSVSKGFIEDLKWLFLRIGILGNISQRKNSGKIGDRKIKESIIYTLRFSGRRQLERFLEVCNPEKSKCIKLKGAIDETKKPFTRSKDILPVPDLVNQVYSANKGKFSKYLTSCLSKENLRNIALMTSGRESEKLKEILELPIRWTKIKKIEKSDQKRTVYDFTIEEDHNFITNFMISHNCIANDLRNNLYDLSSVGLLIEDECHRCIKSYDYTYVAEKYKEQGVNKRVLGLTASPGSEKAKIRKICENLGIEAVEIRTRESEDVKPYIQELKFDLYKVDFPEEFASIRHLLKKIFDRKTEELRSRKLLFMPATKKFLLEAQSKIMRSISSGNHHFNLLLGASACAQAIKIQHALELIETQTLASFQSYMQDLFRQAADKKSKAVQNLVKQAEFNEAYVRVVSLIAKGVEHPKLLKLREIVEPEIKEKKKVIVFSQYRDAAVTIAKNLNGIPGANARVFVGQAKKTNQKSGEVTGLNQREQQELIHDFSEGRVNILVSTSIGEEGLDIPEVDAVVFYEPVPSEIRKIQRAGRTARLSKGKLIMLITTGTRDEAYYWAAFHKEKKMYKAIEGLKEEIENDFADEDSMKLGKQEKLF